MIIETKRLLLRPWKESDAEDLYQYAKDPRVGPIAGWPVHTDVENSRTIIRDVLSAEETYAVCLKEDHKAIGSIGLFPTQQTLVSAENTELEIGYWIGVPFWGNGYIPEAVKALQKYAFTKLGCTAMWCGYYQGNEKSRKCQEKCGFTYHHTEENKPCPLMNDFRDEHYTRLTKEAWLQKEQPKIIVYVHGKGGSIDETMHYQELFPNYCVLGFDYHAQTPWEAVEEFRCYFDVLQKQSASVSVIANSIGAFFTMCALSEMDMDRAFFISPIVNMEKLIFTMMQWTGVTEADLESKGQIETAFGETLSWEYLTWVRSHPVSWTIPTRILYGSKDTLQSMDMLEDFSRQTDAFLTIMEGGEHFFHTSEQMTFLDAWLKSAFGSKT